MHAVAENRAILKTIDARELIVAEKTTSRISGTLLDETNTPVAASAWSMLTLTLYNRDSVAKEIMNSVDGVNILNAGRGTLHATSGLLTITFEPNDNAIVDNTKELEWHRALIQGTYAGAKAFKYEIDFQVRNLAKVA